MSYFLSLIMDFLTIEITLGSFTTSLGSLLFFLILISLVYNHFLDEFLGHRVMDDRAKRHGWDNYQQMSDYENYMAGEKNFRSGAGHDNHWYE